MLIQVVDDRRQRSARAEAGRDSQCLELLLIGLREDAARQNADMLESAGPEGIDQLRDERHVSAIEDADAQPVDILILNGLHHRLDRLPQAAVDDVKASVAQAPGDDLDAAVVAIEADFHEEDSLGLCGRHGVRL